MKEFSWPIRVYYEDTDSGGVVYYANYLRYMERARTEWLRSLGFEQDKLRNDHNVLFAVRRASIEYKKPALFNDEVLVRTTITTIKKASLVFDQCVVRQEQKLVTGEIKIACITADTLKPIAIPEALLAEINHAC